MIKPPPFNSASAASLWMRDALSDLAPTGFMSEAELDERSKIPPESQSALLACAKRHPQALHVFDPRGLSVLHWASRFQSPALIEGLLGLGADPLKSGPRWLFLPLAEGASLCSGPALKILALATGLERILNEDAETALMVAAYNCNERGLADLLALGADPLRQNRHGDTALSLLCNGQKEPAAAERCLALLLSAGADVDAVNHAGLTPLLVAQAERSPLAAPLSALLEREALGAATAASLRRPPSRGAL